MTESESIIIELRQIKKYFGSVKANDGIDLLIRKGEIQAILGENGSGKSTLMNILSGLYSPDSGQILYRGKPVNFHSPKDAMKKGIGMIHQHFKLVEALYAWENIVGGVGKNFFLDKSRILAKIKALCLKYKFRLDPEKRVFQMTIGEKQTVEIIKALYRGAEILILDEPTAVLTTQESDQLFEILREMKANGCAIIIITHKLNEVMEISDTVTVLRKGIRSGSMLTKDVTPQILAELMVGHEVDLSVPYVDVLQEKKKPVLLIKNLLIEERDGVEKLNIKELVVYSHEILGIAGVADSGQKELCEAITGNQKAKGSIHLNGTELIGLTPRDMLRHNIEIGFVPEDRLGMGLVAGLSICDNVILQSYKQKRGLLVDKTDKILQTEKLIKNYNVSCSGVDQSIQNLSGGNIQKVLFGREANRCSNLFIASYPVRGLDIAASDFIYEKLNEEKQKGVAILLIGEDLDVLLSICDRIAVLHNGELMGVVDAKTATKEQLGLLMMGRNLKEKVNASN